MESEERRERRVGEGRGSRAEEKERSAGGLKREKGERMGDSEERWERGGWREKGERGGWREKGEWGDSGDRGGSGRIVKREGREGG